MGTWRLLPRTRVGKAALAVILLPVVACLLFYLCLLAAEYRSARHVSKMLDKLEAIRLGDPTVKFEDAVKGCKIQREGAEYSCGFTAGPFRSGPFLALLQKLPLQQSFDLSRFLDRAGLRFWSFYSSASTTEGHISRVSARMFIAGRYETLGGNWRLASEVPSEYLSPGARAEEQRTLIHWFHITSFLSGEGLTVDTTPASTEKELRSRWINRKCLFTFRGCDGLCDILPNAAQLLREQGKGPGGGTNVPRAACDDR